MKSQNLKYIYFAFRLLHSKMSSQQSFTLSIVIFINIQKSVMQIVSNPSLWTVKWMCTHRGLIGRYHVLCDQSSWVRFFILIGTLIDFFYSNWKFKTIKWKRIKLNRIRQLWISFRAFHSLDAVWPKKIQTKFVLFTSPFRPNGGFDFDWI